MALANVGGVQRAPQETEKIPPAALGTGGTAALALALLALALPAIHLAHQTSGGPYPIPWGAR
jgi:hypothetical protein